MSIKESIIKEYMLNIDFNGEWSYHVMMDELQMKLGEKPAIEVNYKKDVRIDENTGKPIEFKDLDSIDIVFYDDDNRFKKLNFIIGA